jgi:hypothetical protein
MSEHYTDGRRWSHISNAWIFEDRWNDQEEIARLGYVIAGLKEELRIRDEQYSNDTNQINLLTQQLADANGRVERQAQVITEALHELDSSAVDWDSPILRASQLLQAEVDAALSNLNEDSAG